MTATRITVAQGKGALCGLNLNLGNLYIWLLINTHLGERSVLAVATNYLLKTTFLQSEKPVLDLPCIEMQFLV